MTVVLYQTQMLVLLSLYVMLSKLLDLRTNTCRDHFRYYIIGGYWEEVKVCGQLGQGPRLIFTSHSSLPSIVHWLCTLLYL